MVYDSTDGYVLLFGGEWTGGGPYQFYNDTWSFLAGHWTNRTTAHAPAARFGFFLADDVADHEVVLFGGIEAHSSFETDTWAYSGGNWTNITSGVAPPGAFWGSMSYDTSTGTVILFGGNQGGAPSTEYTNDTWSFHAGSWTALAPSVSPSGRDDQNQVDDVADGRVLMFGGLNSSNYLNDTWAYSGGTWSLVTTAVGPDVRGGPGLAYDAAASAVVMYGGFPANTYYYATWVLQGGTWTRYDLTPTPSSGTIWGQMTYDAADRYVVMLQGDGAYNGTWELSFVGAGPPPALSVTATATPSSGVAALPVAFIATATGGTAPYAYAWSFGDGTSSSNQNPSHTYTRAGSYTARLNVTDAASAKVSKNFTIAVSSSPLQATISAQPLTTPVDQTVTFTSTISGGTGPDTFLWEFDDHSSATTANATHQFVAAGTYIVTFVVNDSRGASVLRNVTVTVTAATNPNKPGASSGPNVIPIVVGVLLILVLVFVAFLWYRRRRKPAEVPAPVGAPPPPPPPPT